MERCLAATTADWRSDRRLGPTLGSSDPTEAQVIDRGINRYLIAIRQLIKVVLQNIFGMISWIGRLVALPTRPEVRQPRHIASVIGEDIIGCLPA